MSANGSAAIDLPEISLAGRVVIVAGAGGGGIGTAITGLAARAGATVVAVSRSKENLAAHVEPLAAQGLPVIPLSADASTDEGVAAILEQARTAPGELHGLVKVAGGAPAPAAGGGAPRAPPGGPGGGGRAKDSQ